MAPPWRGVAGAAPVSFNAVIPREVSAGARSRALGGSFLVELATCENAMSSVEPERVRPRARVEMPMLEINELLEPRESGGEPR